MSRRAVLTIRKEPFYRRDAFEKMLAKHGYKIEPFGSTKINLTKEDLLVLWNRKKGADDNAATEWEARGGSVLVAENGYLQKVDKTYYALSLHGHNGSGWFPVGDEDRFTKLGYEIQPRVVRDGYALVCGQRGIGSPLMASPSQWAERTGRKISAAGMAAKLRQHPGNFAAKIPLTDDFKKASSCVIWSSGSGVRALVEGLPVFYDAPHWIGSSAAWRFDVGLMKAPPPIGIEDRYRTLQTISHGQWHFDEIATGEPLARMLTNLGDAKW